MTTPNTTEIPQRLEPVGDDPFIDDLNARAVALSAPRRSADRVLAWAGSDA